MPARSPSHVGLLAVAVVIAAAAVSGAFAYRWADDSDARAAHAEYMVVRDARDRAAVSAEKARDLVTAVPVADRPAAERVAAEADAAVREAEDHADWLRSE